MVPVVVSSSSSGELPFEGNGEREAWHGSFVELQKQTCFEGIRLVSRLHPNGSLVEFSRKFLGTSLFSFECFGEALLAPEGGVVVFSLLEN